MRILPASILAVSVLAACDDGNPLIGAPDEVVIDAEEVDIQATILGNLESATYDPTAETLTVTMNALDASSENAAYTRAPALDTNGYEAYELQETALNRHFIALFKQNPRGNLIAGVVADGGKFGRYWAGAVYTRVDSYAAPASGGLATYVGSYAGMMNVSATATGSPVRTVGDVQVNADFTDAIVNGGLSNRSVVDTGAALDNINMPATELLADGTFEGLTEFTDLTVNGTFAGGFGGLAATDIAGLLVFNPIVGDADIVEHGVFILPKCGTPGDDPICP